jgi:transcriptional regulator with XRE-family HTH domain
MPITLKDKMKELSPAQRKKVEARAAELIAEEMTLRELRHARKLTQVKMAKTLGITQDGVSRLEKRSDLLLSTLRKTVEAMGGNLSLVAEFPDRAPVVLSGIAEDDPSSGPVERRHVCELVAPGGKAARGIAVRLARVVVVDLGNLALHPLLILARVPRFQRNVTSRDKHLFDYRLRFHRVAVGENQIGPLAFFN